MVERRNAIPEDPRDAPIPMRLHCPECGELHVDEGDFALRPHHTHACQSCGMVWRPAVVDTVGVRFLPGFKDERMTYAATDVSFTFKTDRRDG